MQDDTLAKSALVRDSDDAHRYLTTTGFLFLLIGIGVAISGLLLLIGGPWKHWSDATYVMWGLLAYPALPRKTDFELADQEEQDADPNLPLAGLLKSIFYGADGVLNAKIVTFAVTDAETDQKVAGRLQRGLPTVQLLKPGRFSDFHWWRSGWQSVAIVNKHGDLNLSGYDRSGKKLIRVPNTLKPASIWDGPFNRLIIVKLQPDERWEGYVSFCDPEFPRENLAAASLLQRVSLVALKNYEMQSQACAQARIEERLRVARDLHDGVMQSLSISAMRLDEIRRQGAKALNAKSSKALEEAHELLTAEIRRLRLQTKQLRSGLLTEPLVPHLSEVIKEFECRTGITTFFTYDVNVDIISTKLALDLVYMVREGLSNVYKHSHSKFVEVDLTGKDDIHLTISDYGRGFNACSDQSSNRVKAPSGCPRVLHERVTANGGTLLVESQPQHGTRLTINIPIVGQQTDCSCSTENSLEPVSSGLQPAAPFKRSPQSIDIAELHYLRKR